MSAEPAAKRLKLDGEADVTEDAAPEHVLPSLPEEANQLLTDCLADLAKINDECSNEVLRVEHEYNKKRKPLYVKRGEALRSIPGFWRRALVNHSDVSSQLTDEDLDVLAYCTELSVEDFDVFKSGYKISLSFSNDNPFFPQRTLTKAFHVDGQGGTRVEGSDITWAEGREQLMYAPAEGEADTTNRYELFEWMATSEPCELDCMGDWIKDDIWPDPLQYYNAHAEDEEAGLDEGEEGLGAGGYVEGEEGLVEGGEGEYLEGEEDDEGEEFLEGMPAEGEEGLMEGGEGEVYLEGAEGEGEEYVGEGEGDGDGY